MILKDIIDEVNFKIIAGEDALNYEIKRVYACDLLSFVMSKVKEGDAWITVQTHINVVAVASLKDVTCIIIPESIEVDKDTIIKANEESIPIISTKLNCYEIFCKMYELGLR